MIFTTPVDLSGQLSNLSRLLTELIEEVCHEITRLPYLPHGSITDGVVNGRFEYAPGNSLN
jgi:hypothetical protein